MYCILQTILEYHCTLSYDWRAWDRILDGGTVSESKSTLSSNDDDDDDDEFVIKQFEIKGTKAYSTYFAMAIAKSLPFNKTVLNDH